MDRIFVRLLTYFVAAEGVVGAPEGGESIRGAVDGVFTRNEELREMQTTRQMFEFCCCCR